MLLADGVPADLQIEWLVAGNGRRARSAKKLEAALRKVFEQEERYTALRAVTQIAQDTRPDIVQMLMRFRKTLSPDFFERRNEASKDVDEPDVDALHEFDMALYSAKAAPLRALFLARCKALAKSEHEDSLRGDYRCRSEFKPSSDFRYLPAKRESEKVIFKDWTASLESKKRRACEKAAGGSCPRVGFAEVSFGDTWGSLYAAALALSARSKQESPLAGLLIDTPLRLEKGKLIAAFRAWGDGKLYASTIEQLAAASLGWEGAPRASGETLAQRAFVGWLNAVAAARGDPRRFLWIDDFPAGVAVGLPEDLCRLTKAGLLQGSVAPRGRLGLFD